MNTATDADERGPGIAAAPDGSFVVVWSANRPVGAIFENETLIRRFDANGVAIGGEIDSAPTSVVYPPRVAVADDGSFVVVSLVINVVVEGLRYQLFDPSGTPVGSPGLAGSGSAHAVDMAGDGRFVVSWVNSISDEARARQFDAAGNPLGGEIVVGGSLIEESGVGVADDGSFVVVWTGTDGDLTGVLARRYDSAGTAFGPAFVVNGATTGPQNYPAIAMAADGSFVIAWASRPQVTPAVRGQRFDNTGTPLGAEFEIATLDPAGLAREVSVALAADGSFVVTYTDDGEFGSGDGDGDGIFARRYNASGSPLGPVFQVNGFETGNQRDPVVAAGVGGRFVVAWQTDAFDPRDHGIVAQRYLGGFADQPVDALKLLMSRRGTRETLVFLSKDPVAPFPPIGSVEDPATGSPGGTLLDLFSATEGTAQITVPPGLGSPGWKETHHTKSDVYRFSNREAPAGIALVKRAVLKGRKLIKVKASAVGLPLATPQTAVAVRLTTGARRVCALFDAPTIVEDQENSFVAIGASASALPDCEDATLSALP